MSKELTPAELTFQSFPHSQGSGLTQLLIFRYAELSFDVQPDLHPMADDWERFMGYIEGVHVTGGQRHVAITAYEREGAAKTVYGAFKELRDAHSGSEGAKIKKLDLPRTVTELATSIMDRERRIIGADNQPWTGYGGEGEHGRPVRQAARVRAGRSSFLLYFGREGHTTGFTEFDQMYADIWGRVLQDDGLMQYELEQLNYAVVDAERRHLGRLCLGRPNIEAARLPPR